MTRRLGFASSLVLVAAATALMAALLISCDTNGNGNGGKEINLTGTTPASDWWKHQADLYNTGNALETEALAPPLELIHQVQIGSDPQGEYRNSGIVFADGKVYSHYNTMEDEFGRLVGVDIKTGEIVLDTEIMRIEGAGFVHVRGSPVAASGALFMRVIYHEVRHEGGWSGSILNRIYAFSLEDGHVLWNYDDEFNAGSEGILTSAEGQLFYADSPDQVTALQMTDGSVRWNTPLSERVGWRQAPAVAFGSVIVGTSNAASFFSTADGSLQSTLNFPVPYHGSLASPVVKTDVEVGQSALVYFAGTPQGEEEDEGGTGVVVQAVPSTLSHVEWTATLDDESRSIGCALLLGGD